jgi:hypothetical protein
LALSTGSSATAHRREDGHLVTVVQNRVFAVLGLVAVYPHAGGREHGTERRAVHGSRRPQQLAERAGFERVVGASRRLPRLGKQSQPDDQTAISATPSLMTASPVGLVVSKP